MNLVIKNPEVAEFYCKEGCGECCKSAVPIYPAEAFKLSQFSGIPLKKLVVNSRTEPYFLILNNTKYGEGSCIFLDDKNACIVYNSGLRPVICMAYPLDFSAHLDEDLVTVVINPFKKCIAPEKENKLLEETKIRDLIKRGIILKATRTLLPDKTKDTERFCAESHRISESLSLEQAIATLRGKSRYDIYL